MGGQQRIFPLFLTSPDRHPVTLHSTGFPEQIKTWRELLYSYFIISTIPTTSLLARLISTVDCYCYYFEYADKKTNKYWSPEWKRFPIPRFVQSFHDAILDCLDPIFVNYSESARPDLVFPRIDPKYWPKKKSNWINTQWDWIGCYYCRCFGCHYRVWKEPRDRPQCQWFYRQSWQVWPGTKIEYSRVETKQTNERAWSAKAARPFLRFGQKKTLQHSHFLLSAFLTLTAYVAHQKAHCWIMKVSIAWKATTVLTTI